MDPVVILPKQIFAGKILKITKLLIITGLFYGVQVTAMTPKSLMKMMTQKTLIDSKVEERFQKMAWAIYYSGWHAIKTQEEAVTFTLLVQKNGIAPERATVSNGPIQVQVFEGAKVLHAIIKLAHIP